MDNIEAISAIKSVQSGEKFTPNGVDLSQVDNEQVLQQELKTIIGNTDSIKTYLAEKCPDYYKRRHRKIDKWLNSAPAGAIEIFDEHGKSTFESFVNTDNVDDPELIPVLRRHEAIEVVTSDKYLNTATVARQLGIDEDLITNDMDNDTPHYVAMYHELLLARSMGILDKDLEFRRTGAGQKARDIYKATTRPFWKKFIHKNWRQEFKSKAGEKAKLIFLTPKTIANKIKSDF